MTTAERKAMEAYPPKMEFVGNTLLEFDINEDYRKVYAEAFDKAKGLILETLKREEGLFNRCNEDPTDEGMDGVCRGLHRAVLIVEEFV